MNNYEVVGNINKANLTKLLNELDTELGHNFNLDMDSYVSCDERDDTELPLVTAHMLNVCGTTCCAIGFSVACGIGFESEYFDNQSSHINQDFSRNYNYASYSYNTFLDEYVEMLVVKKGSDVERFQMWEFLFGTENENCKYKLRERINLVLNDDFVGIYRYMEMNLIFDDCLIA